jgi:hypothetical protein
MDKLPQVITIVTGGNLGRALANEDGVAALIAHAVANDDFALGDVLVLGELAHAEAKGITADYDDTNSVHLHRHIADFYLTAPSGSPLYVLPVAKTVTVAQMVAKAGTFAPKLLEAANGKIRLLAITSTDSTFANVLAAIPDAQDLYDWAFDNFMPLSILLEGRDAPADLSTLADLRDVEGPDSNRVSVVMCNDAAITTDSDGDATLYEGYGAVGLAMGRLAAIPVQRNIGRVKDGRLPITKPALSNGDLIDDLSLATLDGINGKGYIFMRNHVGKAGAFFNGDHTTCPINSDFSLVARGRVIDKAVRIVRQVYVEELLDDIDIDPDTGRMSADVITSYQQACDGAILVNMLANGEASGARTYVDPAQDVLTTDKVKTKLKIVPKGTVKQIEVELGFAKTLE